MTKASDAGIHQEDTLSLNLKMSWGVGAFGAAILMNSVSALIVYYLAKIVGMPTWLAGVLLSIARLYDAFSDPVIGHLSDRTGDRFGGRRRPYLFVGAIGSAIAILLAFNIPFRGDDVFTIAYVLIVLLFFGTAYSTFNIPFIAMPAEMTNGYHERSSIHGWRVIFAGLGMAVAASGAGLLLGWLADGHKIGGVQVNSARDYMILSVLFSILILGSMMTTWWGTRHAKMTVKEDNPIPWKQQFRTFAGNKPFMTIMGVKAAQLIGVYASQTATFFMVVEVLKRNSGDLALIGLPSVGVSILATPLLLRYARRFGKRIAYITSALFACASYLSWIVAVPNESPLMLVLRGAILGVGFAGNVLFAMSMITDAIEMDSLKTGMRREGMYTAVFSFVEKFSGAIGPTLVGIALSMAGFNAKAQVSAANYESVRNATLLGVAYIPAFFAILSVVILCFYRLDQKDLQQARSDRDASDAALVASAAIPL
jgi:GPH family glycoside/pentoside/hexuronide:cation symporter